MNSIIIWVERNSSWRPDSWICSSSGVLRQDGVSILAIGNSWVSAVQDDKIRNDYCDYELILIYKYLSDDAIAFFIEWRGSSIVIELLNSIPDDVVVLIDNDRGLIVEAHEIKKNSFSKLFDST